jgi:hypothetical protein
MPKSCIICSAVASPEIMLQYCARCQSALYCSKACQRIDWREKQHKKICKKLNVGHGDRQVRADAHANRSIGVKERFESGERSLHMKRFFTLFEESTFEGSRAAAQKMKKFAKRQNKHTQDFLLFHSLDLLARSSNSEMLSWPNSPLLVLLQLVDPNELSASKGGTSITPLHQMAELADSFDYTTHVNQLILVKQLIEHGANVNAVSIPQRMTPLHYACYSGDVTNLDFVEYLLEAGADPNAKDFKGLIPLMWTMPDAPSAAKFLLNWPTTDVNITSRDGDSFHDAVRATITSFSDGLALLEDPDQIRDQFVIQQWRDIEEILVERGATNTGVTTLE